MTQASFAAELRAKSAGYILEIGKHPTTSMMLPPLSCSLNLVVEVEEG